MYVNLCNLVMKMAKLNIVMVEPEIPQNTGNVARTCAATGARLHLVGPMGFKIDDKKLKRAGLDYWQYLDITYYDSLAEFFKKNDGEFYYFTTKGRHVHSDVDYPDNCYLLFGKETKGLPEELLIKNPDTCVRIPMEGEIRSLNLSNSVAIATYEILRQWNYPSLQNFGQLHNYKWEEI
jgi:tRNA (cytidine/uridine-2'-O-)-methyltransferase